MRSYSIIYLRITQEFKYQSNIVKTVVTPIKIGHSCCQIIVPVNTQLYASVKSVLRPMLVKAKKVKVKVGYLL